MAVSPRVVHRKHLDIEDSEEAAAAGELVPTDWNDDHDLEGVAGLDSPAFLNTPTAPTPPLGNATTRLATMEALAAAIAQALGSFAPTPVNAAMSPYVPFQTDRLLQVDTSGGAVVINMKASATRLGLPLKIIDATGNAIPGGNIITVNANGAELINNSTTRVIDTPFGVLELQPKTAGGYLVV